MYILLTTALYIVILLLKHSDSLSKLDIEKILISTLFCHVSLFSILIRNQEVDNMQYDTIETALLKHSNHLSNGGDRTTRKPAYDRDVLLPASYVVIALKSNKYVIQACEKLTWKSLYIYTATARKIFLFKPF